MNREELSIHERLKLLEDAVFNKDGAYSTSESDAVEATEPQPNDEQQS